MGEDNSFCSVCVCVGFQLTAAACGDVGFREWAGFLGPRHRTDIGPRHNVVLLSLPFRTLWSPGMIPLTGDALRHVSSILQR